MAPPPTGCRQDLGVVGGLCLGTGSASMCSFCNFRSCMDSKLDILLSCMIVLDEWIDIRSEAIGRGKSRGNRRRRRDRIQRMTTTGRRRRFFPPPSPLTHRFSLSRPRHPSAPLRTPRSRSPSESRHRSPWGRSWGRPHRGGRWALPIRALQSFYSSGAWWWWYSGGDSWRSCGRRRGSSSLLVGAMHAERLRRRPSSKWTSVHWPQSSGGGGWKRRRRRSGSSDEASWKEAEGFDYNKIKKRRYLRKKITIIMIVLVPFKYDPYEIWWWCVLIHPLQVRFKILPRRTNYFFELYWY